MARFYDECVWNDYAIGDRFRQVNIEKGVVFDVSDVTHNYYSNHFPDQKDPKDFGRIRPPYDNIWLEARPSPAFHDAMTDELVGEDFSKSMMRRRDRLDHLAAFMSTHKADEKAGFLEDTIENGPEPQAKMARQFLNSDARWAIAVMFILDFTDYDQPVTPGMAMTFLTQDGRACAVQPEGRDKAFASMTAPNPNADLELVRFGQALMAPMYFSLAMLNCKNVESEKNAPNEKLAEKQRKTKGSAQTTYRTLVVTVPSSISGGSSNGEADGTSTSQHMVRGHFRELTSDYYTEKQGESVWVPPHVRGSGEEGIVKKDYSVKTREGDD